MGLDLLLALELSLLRLNLSPMDVLGLGFGRLGLLARHFSPLALQFGSLSLGLGLLCVLGLDFGFLTLMAQELGFQITLNLQNRH